MPLFEVDRIRGNQVQRTDTTVEKEISGEPLMTMPIPAVVEPLSFMRSLGFTGRGESVSLVGKVGDSELLLRCCSYWNTGIAPGIDGLAHLCNQCWWS